MPSRSASSAARARLPRKSSLLVSLPIAIKDHFHSEFERFLPLTKQEAKVKQSVF
jgi:hypothetical protein